MPDLHVKYVSPDTGSKYHFVKLPAGNLRGLILGSISGNCQNYRGFGFNEDAYILDCLHRPDSAFYVLIKESKKEPFSIEHLDDLEDFGHEIVGQTPACLGKNNAVSFEALQLVKDHSKDVDLKKLMHDIGIDLEKYSGIERLTIADYATGIRMAQNTYKSNEANTQYTDFVSLRLGGAQYYYRLKQIEVFVSKGLAQSRENLHALTGISNQSHITSIAQAEVVGALWKSIPDDLDFLRDNYVNLTNNYVTSNWDVDYLISLVADFKGLHDSDSVKFSKIFAPLNCEKTTIARNPFSQESNLNLYKYGVTIDQLIGLPEEIIYFLFSKHFLHNQKSLLIHGMDVHQLFDKIQGAKSILEVKRSVVKSIASEKCGEGDTDYIDDLPESRIDALLEVPYLVMYNFSDIKTLANLPEEILSYMTNGSGNQVILDYIEGRAPNLETILQDYTSLHDLQKYTLKNAINDVLEEKPDFNPEGERFVEELDSDLLHFIVNSPYITGMSVAKNVREIVPSNDVSKLEIVKNLIQSIAAIIGERASGYLSTLSEEEFVFFMTRDVSLVKLLSNKALDLYESSPKVTIEVLSKIPELELDNFLYHRDEPWWNGITLDNLIGTASSAPADGVEHMGGVAAAAIDDADSSQ